MQAERRPLHARSSPTSGQPTGARSSRSDACSTSHSPTVAAEGAGRRVGDDRGRRGDVPGVRAGARALLRDDADCYARTGSRHADDAWPAQHGSGGRGLPRSTSTISGRRSARWRASTSWTTARARQHARRGPIRARCRRKRRLHRNVPGADERRRGDVLLAGRLLRRWSTPLVAGLEGARRGCRHVQRCEPKIQVA